MCLILVSVYCIHSSKTRMTTQTGMFCLHKHCLKGKNRVPEQYFLIYHRAFVCMFVWFGFQGEQSWDLCTRDYGSSVCVCVCHSRCPSLFLIPCPGAMWRRAAFFRTTAGYLQAWDASSGFARAHKVTRAGRRAGKQASKQGRARANEPVVTNALVA